MIDVLVIGQGLAGSLLSWQLSRSGKSVVIVADPDGAPTSRTAAGLVNPVTGQRLVKTANVDRLLPRAVALYRELEHYFDTLFFHEREMLRLFRSEKEQQVYEKRRNDPAYSGYLGERFEPGQSGASLIDHMGGFRQFRTGYLDTNALLDALGDYFRQQDDYREARIDYSELQQTRDGIRWREIEARRVIFCEGYLAIENPWFNWLPFQPAKGEILTLQSDGALPSEIINGAKWLLPTTVGEFKLGATYQWDLLDVTPTDEAKQTLLDALSQLLSKLPEYTLVHHGAGVRPATQDRMPFVGMHPEISTMGIFNGFGSKGSLMIPWYAERLVHYLKGDEALPQEVDIKRISLGKAIG